MGEKWLNKFSLIIMNSTEIIWDYLNAAKLRPGTDDFTSPLNEGMLRIFLPKNLMASASFKPANLGGKAVGDCGLL
jgi:hypothetical protein